MARFLFKLTAAGAAVVVAGCAATLPQTDMDPVDKMIIKSAEEVTQALRNLSESTGTSKVILSKRPETPKKEEAGAPSVPAATTVAGRSTPVPSPVVEHRVDSTSGRHQTHVHVNITGIPYQAPPVTQTAPSGAPVVQQRDLTQDGPQRAAELSGRLARQERAESSAQGATGAMPTSSSVATVGANLSKPPAGLEILITTGVWTGELEELIAQIAKEAGWKVGLSTGLKVAPVRISVNATNRSAFELLQDIGAIANGSATIVVSEATRTISVRYPQR